MHNIREISAEEIITQVAQMCIKSNCNLNDDIYNTLIAAKDNENSSTAKKVLEQLIQNADIAREKQMPICQDTGMAIVFVEIGQDIHITGGSLDDAINEGVRLGYASGYLRKSIVSDPIVRKNTNDNTPAVIHYNIVPGGHLKITVAPKGFGSENMSKLFMLKPSDGIDGIKNVVIQTVKDAGENPCPPLIIGVGIGGNFEKCALLSKYALLRKIGTHSSIENIRQLEKELLFEINKLNIGPQGFGGLTTALAVNIETFPTHIAGLPVSVNISCHVTRHLEKGWG